MKKIGSLFKGILIGIAISVGVISTYVVASNILASADNISFDNVNSGSTATNVNGAIDDLYTKVGSSSLNNRVFPVTVIGNSTQTSYDTANVNLSKSYTISEAGVYLVSILVIQSGVYDLGSVSLTGTSGIVLLGSLNSGSAITGEYGSYAIAYHYKVTIEESATITGSASFTLRDKTLAYNKNSMGMNIIKLS